MRKFNKPIVVVSKCLGFDYCRYNGNIINDNFVEILKNFVEFKPVCAEVEIGLGVPRDPVRVVSVNKEIRLIQSSTGLDLTEKMQDFANSFLNSITDIDGFILKSRSPSCGIKDCKVYSGTGKDSAVLRRSWGFFGKVVLDKFPYLPIEDEGRLNNIKIREHFLTKLYTFSTFREVKKSNSIHEIVKFHTENKLLFMSYNQKEMREMGKIIANLKKRTFNDIIADYEQHLFKVFSQAPKYVSNINVLMHGLGYFSDQLSSEEKAFFLDSLERYRNGKVPLSVPLAVLSSLIVRFKEEYLSKQTYFEPYPDGLQLVG
ncbi:MAG: YbgA family protein [Candidatus Poribacteria bacterium]